MESSEEVRKKLGIWGLTGGIGSGKSTIANLFSELGCIVIDADQLAKKIRGPGGAAEKSILNHFGTTDSRELRKIIFSDPKRKKELEAIMHPLIQKESEERFKLAAHERKKAHLPIVYEGSQIIEAGKAKSFRGLIVVTAPLEQRIKWLEKDRRLHKEEALRIIQSQMSDQERANHADLLIKNHGDLDQLKSKVIEALKTISEKRVASLP